MVLLDYEFGMTPSLTAGRRTIKVENRGPQPHEVDFVRLQPGKTAADVLAWLKTKRAHRRASPTAAPPPCKPAK